MAPATPTAAGHEAATHHHQLIMSLDRGRGHIANANKGSGEADLVAGRGGQVAEQAAEAAVGLSGWFVLV